MSKGNRFKALQKALRTACHPSTGEHERLSAFGRIHAIDPEMAFINMVDPEYRSSRTTDEWYARVRKIADERDAAHAEITRLKRRLEKASSKAAAAPKSNGKRLPNPQPELVVVPPTEEASAKPHSFPVQDTTILFARFGAWSSGIQVGTKPTFKEIKAAGIEWYKLRIRIIDELLTTHAYPFEQVQNWFKDIRKGNLTPATKSPTDSAGEFRYYKDLDISYRRHAALDTMREIHRVVNETGIRCEIVVCWANRTTMRKTGKRQGSHAQPTAFPGWAARFVMAHDLPMLSEGICLPNGFDIPSES